MTRVYFSEVTSSIPSGQGAHPVLQNRMHIRPTVGPPQDCIDAEAEGHEGMEWPPISCLFHVSDVILAPSWEQYEMKTGPSEQLNRQLWIQRSVDETAVMGVLLLLHGTFHNCWA